MGSATTPPQADPADLVLLGPQRRRRTVAAAVSDLGIDDGPVAVVTAGWQEREGEDDELCAAIGRPTRNLRLYARTEEVMSSDPELATAWRETQVRLRQLQELYRVRLEHAVRAAREVWNRRSRLDADLVEMELASAVEAVRALDAEHLDRLRTVRAEAEAVWRLEHRPAVAEARADVAREASACRAVVIAGGHVVVLLNRLRLLGIEPLLRSRPVVAWSAGAMVLGRRVVIFHDSPPQGPGAAEVVEAGFAVMDGVVPFPHASRRLRLADAERVAGLARRMAPAACVTFDEGTRLDRSRDGRWVPVEGVRRLGKDGRVEPWTSA